MEEYSFKLSGFAHVIVHRSLGGAIAINISKIPYKKEEAVTASLTSQEWMALKGLLPQFHDGATQMKEDIDSKRTGVPCNLQHAISHRYALALSIFEAPEDKKFVSMAIRRYCLEGLKQSGSLKLFKEDGVSLNMLEIQSLFIKEPEITSMMEQLGTNFKICSMKNEGDLRSALTMVKNFYKSEDDKLHIVLINIRENQG